ncbi:VOC family protein [Lapillicoccus jejuensis]|uniref:VOC family protein n=1 Tax=Lapillicoccus jejuensis TaxID=402171 RepID=UPI00319E70F6
MTTPDVRTVQVTFDAGSPRALGLFWAAALGYAADPVPGSGAAPDPDAVEATADAWVAFLRENGVPEAEHDSAFALVDPTGSGPRLFFQRVPEAKTAKNRVHLDVRAAPGLTGEERMAALEAEADRLVGLGARRVARHEPVGFGAGHLVLLDPRATSSAWTEAGPRDAQGRGVLSVPVGRLSATAGRGDRREREGERCCTCTSPTGPTGSPTAWPACWGAPSRTPSPPSSSSSPPREWSAG